MVSEVRVWHYESPRLLRACPVVVDIEADMENYDFIDRLVGVKHMEIAQSVLCSFTFYIFCKSTKKNGFFFGKKCFDDKRDNISK